MHTLEKNNTHAYTHVSSYALWRVHTLESPTILSCYSKAHMCRTWILRCVYTSDQRLGGLTLFLRFSNFLQHFILVVFICKCIQCVVVYDLTWWKLCIYISCGFILQNFVSCVIEVKMGHHLWWWIGACLESLCSGSCCSMWGIW